MCHWNAAMTRQRRALIALLVADGLRPFIVADVWPKDVRRPRGPADRRVRAFVAACAKIEIVRQAAAPISAYHPVPAFRFCRFGANIGTPFWLEGAPIRGKLMGLRLGHFGGFLRPDWRNYDWLWGRLDGATHLVMMLLERLQAKPCLPADELRHDLHAWVGAGYEQQLDAALTAFLAAPTPPATPANVITNLTLELVRPLHRAIFCSEFHLDPATGLECGAATTGSAPSLRQIDQRITAHLERVTNQVTKADVAAMADAEGGRAVIGQLGAAGLRALGDDPALPAADKIRPVVRGLADVVLAVTQRGPWRWVVWVVYVLALAALIALPIYFNWEDSGPLVEIGTAVCGAAVALLLGALILVFPLGLPGVSTPLPACSVGR